MHTDIQNQTGYLLWVGDSSGSSAFQIAEDCLDGDTFCQAEDAYCALVHIIRSSDDSLRRIVIVNVDRLHSTEMQFFDVLQKYFSNVHVYAWSGDPRSSRMREASYRGAKTIDNNQALVALLNQVFGETSSHSYAPDGIEACPPEENEIDSMSSQMYSDSPEEDDPVYESHSSEQESEIDADLEERLLSGLNFDSSAEIDDEEGADEECDTEPDVEPERESAWPSQVNPERTPPSGSGSPSKPETPLTYYSDQVSTYLPPVPDYSKPLSYMDNSVVDSTPSARVPWKRYADTPRRRPPSDGAAWPMMPPERPVEEDLEETPVEGIRESIEEDISEEDTLIPLVPDIESEEEDAVSLVDDGAVVEDESSASETIRSHTDPVVEELEEPSGRGSSYEDMPLLTVEELEALFGRDPLESDQDEEGAR